MDSSLRTNDADQTHLGLEVMTHMEKGEGCDLIRKISQAKVFDPSSRLTSRMSSSFQDSILEERR